MSYLGNAPARSFISFERQVFTIVNSQTAYALSHSVTNENDIRLVINNVVQEPGSGKAYTATGTALTLSAALTNGTDEMYCVFLGRATATSAPGAGSIGTAQLAADAVTNAKIADDAISDEQLDPTVITGQTAEATIATDDLILLSDTSASGALRKMTRANFVSGVGGNNQPYFQAALQTTAVTLSSGVNTKIPFNALTYNVGGGTWDSSNYRWTPGVAGKYFVTAQASISADSNNAQMSSTVILSQNGTIKHYIGGGNYRDEGQGRGHMDGNSAIMDLDDNDYIEALAQNTSESGANGRIDGETTQTFFSAFKLI